jgi:hypothetical protein
MLSAKHLFLPSIVALVLAGCFEDPATSGTGSSSNGETGDGDGDGDGDGAPGDGDGTPGDGDGDGTPGDGDGMPGDGDGMPGDGDGDGMPGDGDGEPVEPMCNDGIAVVGEVCYGNGVSFTGGDVVHSARLADANGDTNLDVVYLLGDGTIQYHLGDGNGQFSGPVNMSTAIGAGLMVPTEMDGDNHVDLVIGATGIIESRLGNGIGGFTLSSMVAFGIDVTPVMVVASFDQDGDPDVVSAGGTVIRVDLNNGTGAFIGPWSNDTGQPSITGLGVADFTGDGMPDVAIGRNNGIVVRPGNGNQVLFGNFFNTGIGANIQALATGDIDGDAKPDIAYVDRVANNVGWVRGFGGGAFQQPQAASLVGGPRAIVVRDVNADGFDDLIACTANEVAVYQSDGNGGMADPLSFPVPDPIDYMFVDGDANGDSVPDIIVSSINADRATLLLSTP